MGEMKTLRFPGDAEPREIVDQKGRNRLGQIYADINGTDKTAGVRCYEAGGAINSPTSGSSPNCWVNVNSTTHVCLPVNGGEEVKFTAGAYKAIYAFLTTDEVKSGEVPAYCDGYIERTEVAAGTATSFTIPSDCTYLYVFAFDVAGRNCLPDSLIIDGIERISNIRAEISANSKKIKQLESDVNGLDERIGQAEDTGAALTKRLSGVYNDINGADKTAAVRYYEEYGGIDSYNTWFCTENENRTHVCLPVNGGEDVVLTGGEYEPVYAFLTSDEVHAGKTADFCEGYGNRVKLSKNVTVSFVIPADCKYLYLYAIDHLGRNNLPTSLVIDGIERISNIRAEISAIDEKIDLITRKKTIMSAYSSKCVISSSNVWALEHLLHIALPVNGNENVSITAGKYDCIYAFLTADDRNALSNGTPPFCDGYAERIKFSAGVTVNLVTPSDCKYIYFSATDAQNRNLLPASVVVNGVDLMDTVPTSLDKKVDATSYQFGYAHDLSNQINWELGSISSETGGLTSSTSSKRTSGYIPDQVDRIISYPVARFRLFVYDSADTYIGVFDGTDITKSYVHAKEADLQYLRGLYSGCKFKVNIDTENKDVSLIHFLSDQNRAAMFDPCHIPYEDYMINTICIGDSLTAGAWYIGNDTGAPIKENYPYFLQRRTNLTVTNHGICGIKASTMWKGRSGQDREFMNYVGIVNDTELDFSQYDSAIVWLGTNGYIPNTYDTDVAPYDTPDDFAETEMGYYCRILERMISQSPNIRIFLVGVYADGTGNVDTTNTALRSIAAAYKENVVCVIDTSYLKGFTKTDPLHPDNTLHFGKVGNLVLANHILMGMRRGIQERLAMFEQLLIT